MSRQRQLLPIALAMVLGAGFGGIFRTIYHVSDIGGIIELQETSSHHRCTGDTRASLLCVYHQVIYWNQTIYYIITDPKDKPPVPDIAVPKSLDFNTPVKAITHTELVQEVLHVGGRVQGTIEKALLWHRIAPEDLYHLLWENMANVHMLACKQFKKCKFDPDDNLQLIFVDGGVHHNVSQPLDELWRCVTGRPVEEVGNSNIKVPVLIRSLALGIGLEMEGKPLTTGGRYPPSHLIRTSWHARMRSCMKLPADTNLSTLDQPVATLMVREAALNGWAIRNQEVALAVMKKMLPRFIVQAVSMLNMSIYDQAELLSKTAIFISPKSAQVAHLLWMPRNAVFIELDQYGLTGDAFFQLYVVKPLREFHPVAHVRAIPTSPLSLPCRDTLKTDPSFMRLKPTQQQIWLENPGCTYPWLARQAGAHCNVWIRRHCDLLLELDKLERALEVSARHLYAHGLWRTKKQP